MNLLMKRIGANVTIPVMVVLWGVVCACQGSHLPLVPPFLALTHKLGAVRSYHGLLVCRFLLGALEGIIHLHGSSSNIDSVLLQVASHLVWSSSSPAFISAMLCSSALA